jgi:hypothetical protein
MSRVLRTVVCGSAFAGCCISNGLSGPSSTSVRGAISISVLILVIVIRCLVDAKTHRLRVCLVGACVVGITGLCLATFPTIGGALSYALALCLLLPTEATILGTAILACSLLVQLPDLTDSVQRVPDASRASLIR